MVKLKQLLLENDTEPLDILKPRRSKEERAKNWKVAVYKQIQKYIKNGSTGDLDLSDTPITSLPDNLRVGGYLNLWNTPIKSLPDNLSVGGYLNLGYTPIESLPDNLSIGGDLYLWNTPISKKYSKEEIRRMVSKVKGKVHLW